VRPRSSRRTTHSTECRAEEIEPEEKEARLIDAGQAKDTEGDD
jgi:hypothetical protein